MNFVTKLMFRALFEANRGMQGQQLAKRKGRRQVTILGSGQVGVGGRIELGLTLGRNHGCGRVELIGYRERRWEGEPGVWGVGVLWRLEGDEGMMI